MLSNGDSSVWNAKGRRMQLVYFNQLGKELVMGPTHSRGFEI